jgi:hypothetical protein
MNKEFDSSEKIEAYLRNELSPVEKAEFEERISRDPLLQNELTLQQETITSLQEFRKAELKARLNRIDMSETEATSGNFYNYLKVAGLLIMAVMLGYGTMWYINQPKSNQTALSEQVIDTTKANIPLSQTKSDQPESTSVPDKQSISEPTKDEIISSTPIEEKNKPVQPALKSRPVQSNQHVTEPTGSKAIRPENQLEVQQREAPKTATQYPEAPETKQMDSVEKSQPNTKHGIEPNSGGKISSESGKGPGGLIVTYNESPYKFHYDTRNNRLTLYGNFSKGYKKVLWNEQEYIYFEGDFYLIKPHQLTITPLIKITDEELIDKLRQVTERE